MTEKKETINEHFEKTLQQCKEMKDDVKAFVVLAVTDKTSKEGHVKGVNSLEGDSLTLINLVANLDNDLLKAAAVLNIFNKED